MHMEKAAVATGVTASSGIPALIWAGDQSSQAPPGGGGVRPSGVIEPAA